jgi:DNA-directed RNA polymerase subunit RPC12/RpoP
MTAFDKAWAIVKDDDDPECEDCGSKIPSGEQYGCEGCGKDICGLCMTDDQYGYPGYRGDMDDDIHPAYDEVMSQSGAHCPECASRIVQEWNDEKEERMEEEAEEEALRQLEAEAQSEFNQKLDEQPFFGDNRGKMLGQDESPHFHSKFHPDWQDLNRSKDSFESAWGIAKEIDWDTSFNFKEDREKATWSQEDIDRLNARNDKAREALRNRTPLPTRSNENALDRALSRARRENAKPKPKMRITRPDDWE